MTTIAAHFLRAGGRVSYTALLRPPEAVRESLHALGVDVEEAIIEGRFTLDDYHTVTLAGGRLDEGVPVVERIEGGTRARSLRVSDLSVGMLKELKQDPESGVIWENWPPGALSISDSLSQILRFNEEKPYLEWMINRNLPNYRRAKRVGIFGAVRHIHSESFYKRMEGEIDGVVDLRVIEQGQEWKNLICIRSLKGQPHDARWHEIEIKPNGEATLVN